MPLAFLRSFDRWVGIFFLYLLAMPVRLGRFILPALQEKRPRHVFLKLKGGGSLIIALPALLGLRRRFPDAEFILVCTIEAKIYAELTGIFDRELLIDDTSPLTLVVSGWQALRGCFRAALCVDLEHNSLLAAVFAMLTCAARRIGLVKPEQPVRAVAYSDAVSFNPNAPIYIYYDRIGQLLGGQTMSDETCREVIHAHLPPPSVNKTAVPTIGIAPFTSDFARERMMPPQTWVDLLRKEYSATPVRLLIFGSARNRDAAVEMIAVLQPALPHLEMINQAGAGNLFYSAALLTICDEVWAVDSGLLHITRALGISCRSFWGPTMPQQRLRPVDGLREQVRYRPFICSPCVQSAAMPPCGGNNLCMISMADETPDLRPAWIQKQ